MAWRNLAYGSQSAADLAPVVAPQLYPEEKRSNVPAESVPKSTGGKIYRILEFLKYVPNHKPVGHNEIFENTGIDLTMDEPVDQRLKNNPKVVLVGDKYAYQAKYNVKNKAQLLKMLDRVPDGIPRDDLSDCYVGINDDLDELTRLGHVISIRNTERGADTFYSRSFLFLTDLSSKATIQSSGYLLRPQKDVMSEIRRGDAIQAGEHWFRVSNAVKGSSAGPGASMSGQATKSVTSVRDPVTTKKLKYMLPFDEANLPLDAPFPTSGRATAAVSLRKHGCTNDIRQLWNDTLRHWPTDRLSFERELVKAGLTTQEMLEANRRQKKPRIRHQKERKKRKQRAIKISNQHLLGTELGDMLTKGHGDDFTLGAVQFDKK